MAKDETGFMKFVQEVSEEREFARAYFERGLPAEVIEAIAKEQKKGYARTLAGALAVAKINGWKADKKEG